ATDPSHYYGIPETQASIEVEILDFFLNPDRDMIDGTLTIDNEALPDTPEIAVRSIYFTGQYKDGNGWKDLTITGCQVDPEAPFVFGDTINVDFNCQVDPNIPEGATVRWTANVEIWNRLNKEVFIHRLSKTFP
ncbi:MAG: hypothetical protein KAS29_21615, partial [Bacteroidales bacterium]|nr:hypothetical protein [Bacteroidales bacterium]